MDYVTLDGNVIRYPSRWDRKKMEFAFLEYQGRSEIFSGEEAFAVMHTAHQNKINKFLMAMHQRDRSWIADKIYFHQKPNNIFVEFTNHEQTMFYYYRASESPASGQGYFFCKEISPKSRDIMWSNIEQHLQWLAFYSHYGCKIGSATPWTEHASWERPNQKAIADAIILERELKEGGADYETIATTLSLIC